MDGDIRTYPLPSGAFDPPPLVTPDGYVVASHLDGLRIVAPDGQFTDLPSESPPVPLAVAPGSVVLSGRSLAAVDLAAGETLWTSPDAGGTRPPPAVHRGVAFSVHDRDVTAVSLDGGQLLWRTEIGRPGFGDLSVEASDKVVAVGGSQEIVALDPWTGEVRWQADRDMLEPASDGTEPEGGFGDVAAGSSIVAVATDATLVAFDATSGRVSWHVAESSPPTAGMAIAGANLYYTTGGRDATLVARRNGTGQAVWTLALPGGTATTAPSTAGLDIAVLVFATASTTQVDDLEVPLHDTVAMTVSPAGSVTSERRFDHAGGWQLATAGGWSGFAGEIGETATSHGTWELVVIAPQ